MSVVATSANGGGAYEVEFADDNRALRVWSVGRTKRLTWSHEAGKPMGLSAACAVRAALSAAKPLSGGGE